MIDESQAFAALQMWGLDEEPVRETSGVNKQTWKIGDAHWLVADSPDVADIWHTVAEILRKPELQYLALPRAFASTNGDLFPFFQGRLWRLTSIVEGAIPVPSRVQDLDSVAAGLAKLHHVMKALSREHGRHNKPRQAYVERACELVEQGLLPFTKQEETTVLTVARFLQAAGEVDAEHQLIHGDPSYPNLRLNQDGLLCGVIDWEGVRWESPLLDLAVVGQTILYRSGWGDARGGLQRLLEQYQRAGGRVFSVRQLLLYILIIKFGSITHHGQRLVDGGGDVELVRSQPAKIAVAWQLLLCETGE